MKIRNRKYEWKVGKKTAVVIVAVAVVVCAFCLAKAFAEEEPNAYVTAAFAPVWEVPDSDANALAHLKNMEEVTVVDDISNYKGEQFYVVLLSSVNKDNVKTEDESGNPLYGYVLKNHISVSGKTYITLPTDIEFLAWPKSEIIIGQKSAGTKMMLLGTYEDKFGYEWLVFQMQDAEGVGFARRDTIYTSAVQQPATQQPAAQQPVVQDAQQPTADQGYLYKALVSCDTLGVRGTQDDDAEPIGYIHHGDVVKVLEVGEYFTCIEYTYNGATVPGYVHTMWNKSPTLIQIITGK